MPDADPTLTEAIARTAAMINRIPDSDAVTLDKTDARVVFEAAKRTAQAEADLAARDALYVEEWSRIMRALDACARSRHRFMRAAEARVDTPSAPTREQATEAVRVARLTWAGGGDGSFDTLMADAVMRLYAEPQ